MEYKFSNRKFQVSLINKQYIIQETREINEDIAYRIETKWMNGNEDDETNVWSTQREIIRKKNILDKVEVVSVMDKMRKERLKWLRHACEKR
ncbi:hypothetical protein H5410_029823 [Solanum commersonii]|uniref:Uncharacterized protein n=1 Tax=Solanum commersonii TaxID=4109 RepID=A0A9J5YEC5_SOLCO|nr:hypothetical protein H5410_029823 [Solanum commersonii]